MYERSPGGTPEFVTYETPMDCWEDIVATPVTKNDIDATRAALTGGSCNFVAMLKLDEKAIVLATQLRLFDYGDLTNPGGGINLNEQKSHVGWYGFEAYALRYNMVADDAAPHNLDG